MSKECWLVVVAALADAEQSALAPVEYCLGPSPSQDTNSRPLRKAAPFADRRNDRGGDQWTMPGICRSLWQAASEDTICATSIFIATICCLSTIHSLQRIQVARQGHTHKTDFHRCSPLVHMVRLWASGLSNNAQAVRTDETVPAIRKPHDQVLFRVCRR